MKILVVGGGGREHAICQALLKSRHKPKLYCVPGNAGIAALAECINLGVMDFEGIADLIKAEGISLTIVGPDDPLAAGIVDFLTDKGFRVFGPSAKAARIESSKAFSKGLMRKYGIPTADYAVFDDAKNAINYLKQATFPIVIKADGLALGKGVLICKTYEDAVSAVNLIMEDKVFGAAGNSVVIEEFLIGREVSMLAFCDGSNLALMSPAQDHKRALDGDLGLNTGGMGTFSPTPFYTKEIDAFCKEHIYKKTVEAMEKEGCPFKGILYFGLILTEGGVKVLEYNARFGDPETQVVLPRLKSDLVDIINACIDGTLEGREVLFDEKAAVCVIMASGGYPESYDTGKVISGLDSVYDADDVFVFHSGTKRLNGQIVTSGGRVLGVTALGADMAFARKKAYNALGKLDFEGAHFRSDIGKALDV